MPSKTPQQGSYVGKVLLYHDKSLVGSPPVAQVSWIHPLNFRSYDLQHFCCLQVPWYAPKGSKRWELCVCFPAVAGSNLWHESPLPVLHRKPRFQLCTVLQPLWNCRCCIANQHGGSCTYGSWLFCTNLELKMAGGHSTLLSEETLITETLPWPSVGCPFCCKPHTTGIFHDRWCKHCGCLQLSNYLLPPENTLQLAIKDR